MSIPPPSEPQREGRKGDRLPLLSLLFLLLLSCARTLSQQYPVSLADHHDVVEGHLEGHRAISTDRRVFTFQLRYGFHGARGEGVFLYSWPGKTRIDLYVGASELVFQYLRNPGRSLVILPSAGRTIEGSQGTIIMTGIEGLEGMPILERELVTMMLGLYDGIGNTEALMEVRAGEDGYLLCYRTGEEHSYVHLDRQIRSLTHYEVFSAGRKIREIRFSDFREIGGILRPQEVVYHDVVRSLEIQVRFREESINGSLDPRLFDPPSSG